MNVNPMDYEKYNIRTIPELAGLPWFEEGEGGIRIRTEAGVPPVLDVHTHLGFSFGFSSVINLKARTKSVTYFWEYNQPQDILGERTLFGENEEKKLTEEMWWVMVKTPPRAHTHTLPNQIAEMDRCGVSRAVSLPVEIPFWPRHAEHTIATLKGQDRVVSFAGVHPWDIDPRAKLKRQLSEGCLGLKYHPEFQFHPPDSSHALRLFGFCEEMNVVVLSHSGSTGSEPPWLQKLSDLSRFKVLFKNFPKLRFILGHAGIRDLDKAIAYSREFPNVYLETSGQPVPALLKIFSQADHDRVLFGSDWPFFPIAVSLARALVATEGDPELRKKFLRDNAAKLLGI